MLHGSCLCGAVRYAIDISGEQAAKPLLCHCRVCRKITGGSTSHNVTILYSAFTLKSGELKVYQATHFDEGFEVWLHFCPTCGSPIFAGLTGSSPAPDDQVFIQGGTLDDTTPLESTPVAELNVKYRLSWVGQIQNAEQRQGYL
ncbi:Mss4-like protein [Fusarium solani]|uniref:Mss4-like protein n=1 Tax=Fusarium solani TaxID=169388 RepID=A0A9P9RBT2_FUSSL|nr:Mss4-like protein [Fusarium solani]KAH7273232.1 Mss4-like protein [Fusarium solani]